MNTVRALRLRSNITAMQIRAASKVNAHPGYIGLRLAKLFKAVRSHFGFRFEFSPSSGGRLRCSLMTYFHFFNCAALCYLPSFFVYKCSRLCDPSARPRPGQHSVDGTRVPRPSFRTALVGRKMSARKPRAPLRRVCDRVHVRACERVRSRACRSEGTGAVSICGYASLVYVGAQVAKVTPPTLLAPCPRRGAARS